MKRLLSMLIFIQSVHASDTSNPSITVNVTNYNTVSQYATQKPIITNSAVAQEPAAAQITPATFSFNYMPLLIIAGAAVFTYGGLVLYVKMAQRWIEDPSHLAHWKKEIPLAALQQLPAHEIIKELLHWQKNVGKSSEPLFFLLRTLQHEQAILERYLKLASLIALLKIESIMPETKSWVLKAQEQIQRLIFLQECMHRVLNTLVSA